MATTFKATTACPTPQKARRIQRTLVERMEDACDRFDMMLTELKDLGKPTYSLGEARERLGLPHVPSADSVKAK